MIKKQMVVFTTETNSHLTTPIEQATPTSGKLVQMSDYTL